MEEKDNNRKNRKNKYRWDGNNRRSSKNKMINRVAAYSTHTSNPNPTASHNW